MPVATGVAFGDMNIGKDVAVDITLPSGDHLRIGNITMFDRKPKVKKLGSNGIDGVPRMAVLPEGWTVTFEADRQGPEADDWWAALEEAYYAGDVIRNATITETITETDGSLSQYRYEGVALHFTDAGRFTSNEFVKVKFEGEASFRKKIV